MISVKLTIHRSILYVFIYCFLPINFLYSQTDKEIDRTVNSAVNEIYSNPDKVIKIGEKIVANAGKNVNSKIKGYVLISDAYSSNRDYEKSLEYVIKANQLLPLTNDVFTKISVLNKTGVQYQQLRIYEKSIQYLDQAEQMIKAYPYKDSIHHSLGLNYIVKGFIYREKQADQIAVDFFDRAVAELLKTKKKTFYGLISIAKYNKGNCCITLVKDKLAFQNFTEAFEYARTVNARSLQSFALKGKAQVYTFESNYPVAIQTLKEALLYAAGVNDLILYREIYKGLSENYLAVNNLVEYTNYHSKYLDVKKRINARERKSISDSLDEKTKELNENIEKKSKNFYLIYSMLIFCLLLITFLLQTLTKIKKKRIELKKKEIQFAIKSK